MAERQGLWAEAKKKCRLNAEEVQMAKEMGLNPRSLIKNVPAKNEQWKAPVKIWIRDMYAERFGRTSTAANSKKKGRKTREQGLPF